MKSGGILGKKLTPDTSNLYIIFMLEDRSFALPVKVVERIIHAVEITPLPDSTEIAPGLINMGGEIIRVINIRKSLNIPERKIKSSDRFIIVKADEKRVALIADSVGDILNVPNDDVIKSETINERSLRITGTIRLEKGVIPILDIDWIFTLHEGTLPHETAQAPGDSTP
jgi:purine-binding chemotaxis protein CheW